MNNSVGYFEIGKNGRIGNQLFQIFTTVGYAYRHMAAYHFNRERIFDYLPNIKPLFKYFNSNEHWNEKQNLVYEEIPYSETDIHLHGYFQSYKYFDELPRTFFKFHSEQTEKYLSYTLDYDCFIHIRRGDYVTVSSLLLSEHYYRDAIEYMKNLGFRNFLIFTDDAEYCRVTYPEYSIAGGSGDDYIDLLMMSKFRNGIISNSSYSWWGAMLNNEPEIIIAPTFWFNKNEPDTSDILPKKWIKIWGKNYITKKH